MINHFIRITTKCQTNQLIGKKWSSGHIYENCVILSKCERFQIKQILQFASLIFINKKFQQFRW